MPRRDAGLSPARLPELTRKACALSIDARDWVWTRSASKGTARLVLLAVADKCADGRCVAYAGTTMLMQHTRAARSTVITAVDRLLAAGELEIVEGLRGPRGETVYRLPRAVGHVRADAAAGGPEAVPPGSGNRTPQGVRESHPWGPESVPEGSGNATPGGPESGPQKERERKQEEQRQPPAPAREPGPAVAEPLRPLVAALDAVGVTVRWTLGLGEQRTVWQLAQRHGVGRLVDLAAHRTAPGDPPKSARYWLKVWSDLDRPRPGPSTAAAHGNVVPLRGRAPASHTDTLLAGLALLEERENV